MLRARPAGQAPPGKKKNMDYRRLHASQVSTGRSLCDSCRHALVAVGEAECERVVMCNWPYPAVRITFTVAECSRYSNASLPDVEDLEEIATDLTQVRSSKIGFRRDRKQASGELED
jgi:hypothetical protein